MLLKLQERKKDALNLLMRVKSFTIVWRKNMLIVTAIQRLFGYTMDE